MAILLRKLSYTIYPEPDRKLTNWLEELAIELHFSYANPSDRRSP